MDNATNSWFTIDEAISGIGIGKFQYKLMFLTGFIWAADAMEMMLLSFLIPKLKEDWDLEKPEDGMIGFVVFLGNFFGTMFFAVLSDRFGRRKVVIFCNLFCGIFGVLTGLAPNIGFLLFFRFAVGFTIGGAAVSFTLFAEYAPKELRGMLLIIEQVLSFVFRVMSCAKRFICQFLTGHCCNGFWSFGALFSVFLAWITLSFANWRWYLILSAVPLWIISMFYKWVPESCRYLLASGQYYQAQLMLQRLAKENGGKLPPGRLKSVHLKYLQTHQYENNNNDNNNNNNNNNNSNDNQNIARNNDNENNNNIDTNMKNSKNSGKNKTKNSGADYVMANMNSPSKSSQSLSSISSPPKLDDPKIEDAIIGEFETSKISVQRGRIQDAFVPAYRRTTILLLISFFLCVFGYYGISFISERYFETSKDSEDSGDEYWEMAVTTASEIPGLILGSLFLDKLGRKKAMIYCFGTYTICCFALMFNFIQYSRVLGVIFVFLGRMTISLGFLVIYVYYSEYYPTVIRTTTLGFASGSGRIAGMFTSFVSEDMSLTNGMLLYGVGGLISTICILFLERDTTGMDMPTEINKQKVNVNNVTGHVELQELELDTEELDELELERAPGVNQGTLAMTMKLSADNDGVDQPIIIDDEQIDKNQSKTKSSSISSTSSSEDADTTDEISDRIVVDQGGSRQSTPTPELGDNH